MKRLENKVAVVYGDGSIGGAGTKTLLIGEVLEIQGKSHGITFEQFQSVMEGMTRKKRLITIEELTNAAVFVASDEARAITGTILNLTAGMIVE